MWHPQFQSGSLCKAYQSQLFETCRSGSEARPISLGNSSASAATSGCCGGCASAAIASTWACGCWTCGGCASAAIACAWACGCWTCGGCASAAIACAWACGCWTCGRCWTTTCWCLTWRFIIHGVSRGECHQRFMWGIVRACPSCCHINFRQRQQFHRTFAHSIHDSKDSSHWWRREDTRRTSCDKCKWWCWQTSTTSRTSAFWTWAASSHWWRREDTRHTSCDKCKWWCWQTSTTSRTSAFWTWAAIASSWWWTRVSASSTWAASTSCQCARTRTPSACFHWAFRGCKEGSQNAEHQIRKTSRHQQEACSWAGAGDAWP